MLFCVLVFYSYAHQENVLPELQTWLLFSGLVTSLPFSDELFYGGLIGT